MTAAGPAHRHLAHVLLFFPELERVLGALRALAEEHAVDADGPSLCCGNGTVFVGWMDLRDAGAFEEDLRARLDVVDVVEAEGADGPERVYIACHGPIRVTVFVDPSRPRAAYVVEVPSVVTPGQTARRAGVRLRYEYPRLYEEKRADDGVRGDL